jgi:hypothetical protein
MVTVVDGTERPEDTVRRLAAQVAELESRLARFRAVAPAIADMNNNPPDRV